MVGSRKYSGSSSFLHKFQRSSSGEESFAPQSEAEESVEVAPEAILEVLADGRKMPIEALEARFEVEQGGLDRAIDSLLAHQLAERAGKPPVLYLTSVGMRAAGFSKIARK